MEYVLDLLDGSHANTWLLLPCGGRGKFDSLWSGHQDVDSTNEETCWFYGDFELLGGVKSGFSVDPRARIHG